jgi:mannose-1-phosphate guanylyltransferase
MSDVTQAVVLVGGFGTRLRPLTNSTPKQMLPILHRPMIEHVIDHLAEHGIEEAVLSMGYRPDRFTETYPEGVYNGVKLHYAVEPEPLDTAGAIRFAAKDAGIAEQFVVINGDVLTDLDIGSLVAFHDERGAEATIALHRVDDPSAFGVVPTDPGGRVLAFVEKPPRDEAPTNLINAGTYVLEPSVLDRIDDGRKVSVEREVFPAMVADGVLYATPGDTYWIDTGTPAKFIEAHLDLIDGLRRPGDEPLHATCDVHPDASVDRSVVMDRASVGAGAHLHEAVILPGAVIEAGAHVERSIVGPRSRIGAGAVLTGLTVIGDDEVVPAGAHLDGVKQPDPG